MADVDDALFDEVLDAPETTDCWDVFGYVEYDGCTPAEAMDFFVVEDHGWTQTDWASRRGVDQSTVSENVAKARKKIEDDA